MTNSLLDFFSPTLRQHMQQNNLCFTDFEAAGLIYNSHLPPKKSTAALKPLHQKQPIPT